MTSTVRPAEQTTQARAPSSLNTYDATFSIFQAFLRSAGSEAKYVTSVCSGAMILAESGLLDGYRVWAEYLKHPGWNAFVDNPANAASLVKSGEDLLECKNFGVTSLNEIREKLTQFGIKLRGE